MRRLHCPHARRGHSLHTFSACTPGVLSLRAAPCARCLNTFFACIPCATHLGTLFVYGLRVRSMRTAPWSHSLRAFSAHSPWGRSLRTLSGHIPCVHSLRNLVGNTAGTPSLRAVRARTARSPCPPLKKIAGPPGPLCAYVLCAHSVWLPVHTLCEGIPRLLSVHNCFEDTPRCSLCGFCLRALLGDKCCGTT